ncbi:peripheral-type benzodiazepine receptor-associated protein 1 [Daktulosphaira vitifoliae]|uniref:peripheral-type benzodiazepine receptor-associated protein 1 n=1 Tax=Daktulosphaira vitifoliae TaxID=58002 RepID=UPI0021AA4ED3|nr:peripheral-type benzodiazepine receptor-associated protein 1 [Daktulosphaira vitifoliae]
METESNCKYYVTKCLGLSGSKKPECVYDVRTGNVQNHNGDGPKSFFRVFYKSRERGLKGVNGRTSNKPRESYTPSLEDEQLAGVTISRADNNRNRSLEDDTVEDIEKKFLGFRNVFEKCKVKKGANKKKPTLFNVSSGLRFTLVANSIFLDGENRAGTSKQSGIKETTAEDELCARVEDSANNSCPKDVADKVNSWIDKNDYGSAECVHSGEEEDDDCVPVQNPEQVSFQVNSDLSEDEASTAFALEDQLVRVLEKNTELTIQNTDLHKQVLQLQHAAGNSHQVKKGSGLSSASARGNLDHEIDEILKLMQDASDKKRSLEKEHKECINQLQEKQKVLQTKLSNINYAEKTRLCEHIESLQSKIREFEKKMELENVRQEELQLELEHHKKTAIKSTYKNTDLSLNSPAESTTSSSDPKYSSLNHSSLPASLERTYSIEQLRQHRIQSAGDVLDTTNTNKSTLIGRASTLPSEIDRIMAKIDQDNRVLAELDKTRSTIVAGGHGQTALQHKVKIKSDKTDSNTAPLRSCLKKRSLPSTSNLLTSVPNSIQVQEANYALSSAPQSMNYPYSELYRMASGHLTQTYQPLTIGTSVLPSVGPLTTTTPALETVMLATGQQSRLTPKGRIMPAIPSIINAQQDIDYQNNIINDALALNMDSAKRLGERRMPDMLDIPGKGQCYVYCARFTYDPFYCSPNENFEEELPITAGDYILVWGNKDEDGFFDGELLDGRRGLVPSNYVQQLYGRDLEEFYQSMVVRLRECDDSATTTVPQNIEYMLPDEQLKRLAQQEYNNMLDDYQEDDNVDDDDMFFSLLVPAPKQLTLERQLNKSVLIGWNAPSPEEGCLPESYHVYVDGNLKTTIKATERTRALVEGVDSNKPHRISVRSVTANRRTSRDAACTMVIGKEKELPLRPSHVKASQVTSTSAVISWLPSNSNFQHVVCVNNVELRTVKPGVYKHTITGLVPNTLYRVTVSAKTLRAPTFDQKRTTTSMEKFSTHINFKTLPKGCKGLPDPPSEIQVESGPQDGTLLVTWLPVTTALSDPSNRGYITGYAVYADGKKVSDIDSPTGDHALIDITQILSLNPRQVTVRTKSIDNQSPDSIPVPIPGAKNKSPHHHHHHHKEEDKRMKYGSAVPSHMRPQRNAYGQVIVDTETENLSDKEIFPGQMSIPSIEVTKEFSGEGNYSEEEFIENGRGARRTPSTHPHRPAAPTPRSKSQHHTRHHYDEREPSYYQNEKPIEPKMKHGTVTVSNSGVDQRAYRGRNTDPRQAGYQKTSRDKRPRWVVAIYDYDPTTMSPNPDVCDEELPFKEGEHIKIYGDKDPDGFYWGESRGRFGYVPHNMVMELSDVQKGPDNRGRKDDRWIDPYSGPVKKMVALYDYDPTENSPNVDGDQVELHFKMGQTIFIYGDMDDDGFYRGECNGIRGLVPSNFLMEVGADYGPEDTVGSQQSKNQIRPSQHHHQQQIQQQQDIRGHGPGARGPPPPPRGIDQPLKRKDACLPQYDYHQMSAVEARERGDPYERRDGRDGLTGYGPSQTGQQNSTSGKLFKGLANVVPDFGLGNRSHDNQQHQQHQQPAGGTSSFMQKLNDLTHHNNANQPTNAQQHQQQQQQPGVDNILSKGKELIFMKFGLGK